MKTLFEIIMLNELYKDIKAKLTPNLKEFIHFIAPAGKVGKYGEWIAQEYGHKVNPDLIDLPDRWNPPFEADQEANKLKKLFDVFERTQNDDIKDLTRDQFETKMETYIEDMEMKKDFKAAPSNHIVKLVDTPDYRIDFVKSHYGAKWYDHNINPDVDSSCTWCVGKSMNFWQSQTAYGKLYFVYIQNKNGQKPHDFFAVRYFPNGKVKDIFNNASPNVNTDKVARDTAMTILQKEKDKILPVIKAARDKQYPELQKWIESRESALIRKAIEVMNEYELETFVRNDKHFAWIWIYDDADDEVYKIQVKIAKNISMKGLEQITKTEAYTEDKRLRLIVNRRLNLQTELSGLEEVIFNNYDAEKEQYYFDLKDWDDYPMNEIIPGGAHSDEYSWIELQNRDASDFAWDAEHYVQHYLTNDEPSYYYSYSNRNKPTTYKGLGRFIAEALDMAAEFGFHKDVPALPGMENLTERPESFVYNIIQNVDPEELEAMTEEIVNEIYPKFSEYIYNGMRSDTEERFFDGLSTSFAGYEDLPDNRGHRIFLDQGQEEKLLEWINQKEEEGDYDPDDPNWLDADNIIKDFISEHHRDDYEYYMELYGASTTVDSYLDMSYSDDEEFEQYFLDELDAPILDNCKKIVRKYMDKLKPRESIPTFEQYLRNINEKN